MSPTVQALLAVLPIALAGVLLVGLRWPARRAMPVVYLAAAALALTLWQVPAVVVAAASLQGLVITVDILLIVFAAILLLEVLRQSGGVAVLQASIAEVSDDRRVQLVIVAWLFGSFLEGAAGFGTPAAVAAPLLVALGFPAACAVMAGMTIQSTAVTFGGAGTPILVGVRGGLGDPGFAVWLTEHGMTMPDYLQAVAQRSALLHAIPGTLMPVVLVAMATRWFGAERSWRPTWEMAPFALFAGVAFALPYYLAAIWLGPEFPSLFGALVGLAVVVPAARVGWLVPTQRWDFAPRQEWPASWNGTLRPMVTAPAQGMSVLRAWLPYGLVAGLLIATRLPQLPLGGWLRAVEVRWPAILGTSVSAASTPLYLPATVLLVVAMLTLWLHRVPRAAAGRALSNASRLLLGAGGVLVFTVPMVRIYINSADNGAGLPGMPIAMAAGAADLVGVAWPACAGVVGALGAFLAGSNTVSNLMLATFQHGVATELGLQSVDVVALQAVGAAAGNMIAIHNVVAAAATVGLLGREGDTLRRTVLPMLLYLTVVGALGLWFAAE